MMSSMILWMQQLLLFQNLRERENLIKDRSNESSPMNCDLKSSQSRTIELRLDVNTRGREWISRISVAIYPVYK